MSVKDIFEPFSAEALNCIFVKAHLISKDHLPCILYAAEISFGVSGILVEIISLAVAGHMVLKGVSLDVYPNEILGLIGGSGSGKTTLIRSLKSINFLLVFLGL